MQHIAAKRGLIIWHDVHYDASHPARFYMKIPTEKKILFLITKSNWGEKRILAASQDLAYYFWRLRTKVMTRYTAAVSGNEKRFSFSPILSAAKEKQLSRSEKLHSSIARNFTVAQRDSQLSRQRKTHSARKNTHQKYNRKNDPNHSELHHCWKTSYYIKNSVLLHRF